MDDLTPPHWGADDQKGPAMTDLDELERLLAKATPGDLSTAERHALSEYVECPMCAGDGEVGATDYCNFDGVALGVQFYGIGHEFGAHEKLWIALRNAAPAMIAELKALRDALIWCSGSADFNEGGIAREGWLKLCRPLLETRRATAMNELTASTADEYGVQNSGTD